MKRSTKARLCAAVAKSYGLIALSSVAYADSTWIGGGGNQFMDNAANWDNGVPTGAIANFGQIGSNVSAQSDTGVSFLGINIDNSGTGKWTITRSGNDANARTVTVGASGLTATGSGVITWGAFNTIINTNQVWNIAEGLSINAENIAQFTFNGTMTKAGLGTFVLGSGGLGSGGIVVSEGVLASTRSTTPVGTGGITINAGAMFESRGALVNNAPMYLQAGATILSNGSGAGLDGASTINLLNTGGTVTLTTGNAATDNFRIRSVVLGGDATNVVEIRGSGVLSLEGGTNSATAFAGKWKMASGTVRLFDLFGLGNRSGASSTTNVANPTQIELSGGTIAAGGTGSTSTAMNFNNPINVTGDAAIQIAMNAHTFGATAVAGVSRKFGALTIGANTLSIGLYNGEAAFNVTGSSSGGSSTTQIGFTTGTLTGNATFNVVGSAAGLNFASPLAGVNFGFTKTGDGFMNLGGANTYSGGTTVAGGKLNFGATNGITSTKTLEVQNNSTIGFNNGAASPTWTLTSTSVNGTGLISAEGTTNTALVLKGLTISPGTAATSGKLTLQSTGSGTKTISLQANGTTQTSMAMNVSGAGAVAGTDYDQLAFGNSSVLSGNLSSTKMVLTVNPTLTLADFISGQTMTLISAPGVNFTGMSFASVTYSGTDYTSVDTIYYAQDGVFLQLPEPSCLTMLGLAGMGMLSRRKRKRSQN